MRWKGKNWNRGLSSLSAFSCNQPNSHMISKQTVHDIINEDAHSQMYSQRNFAITHNGYENWNGLQLENNECLNTVQIT